MFFTELADMMRRVHDSVEGVAYKQIWIEAANALDTQGDHIRNTSNEVDRLWKENVELANRIIELERHNNRLQARYDSIRSAQQYIEILKREKNLLRKALAPFAKMATAFTPNTDWSHTHADIAHGVQVRIGQILAARGAYEKTKEIEP